MWVEKNGPTYRIRDLIAGKKVTLEVGYPTKTSAKKRMTALRADQLRGDFIDPRGGKILLNDWIDSYWPSYESTLKPSARRSEESRVRIHIRPLLGTLPLAQIGDLTVQQFVHDIGAGIPDPQCEGKWLRRPLSPKSVRNVHAILHKLLQAAVSQRYLRLNPSAGSAMPPRVHKEMRFLTAPEIGRLLAACSGEYERWRPFVLLMLATGLRYGEATGLRVGDVDVLAGSLTVLRTRHEVDGGAYLFTEPKTSSSRRTVMFPREVAAELAGMVTAKDRGDSLFTMDDGTPMTRNFRQRIWLRIRERAGVDGLRLHDLRHTHAAVLISAGTPLTAVQRRLGHSSIRVTSDLYGHLMPEVHDSIVSAVSAMLPGQREAAPTQIVA